MANSKFNQPRENIDLEGKKYTYFFDIGSFVKEFSCNFNCAGTEAREVLRMLISEKIIALFDPNPILQDDAFVHLEVNNL